MIDLRGGVVDHVEATPQHVVRPVPVLAHDDVATKWKALPRVATDGRTDVAEEHLVESNAPPLADVTASGLCTVHTSQEEADQRISVRPGDLPCVTPRHAGIVQRLE